MVLLHFRTPLGLGLGLTVKLSAAFFHDESSITLGWGGGAGVQKCNSTKSICSKDKHINSGSIIYITVCFQTVLNYKN